MLVAVTFVSIVLGALVWIAQISPETFFYAFVFTSSIGIFGVGVIALSTVMLFSVYASNDSRERKLNIAKCKNLALIGALMMAIPILVAFATFVLLPVIQRG